MSEPSRLTRLGRNLSAFLRGDPDSSEGTTRMMVTWTGATAIACGLIGLFFIAIYGLQCGASSTTVSVMAVGALVSGAAFVAGAALGFLFGIPKTRQAADVVYAANTNLEQISDWLTKILVGVGLIQFREIGAALDTLGNNLAQSLGGSSSADTFGLAISMYFTGGGFLVGYILTRLLLPVAFTEADQALADQIAGLKKEALAQNERDAYALMLHSRQVEASRRADTDVPTQEELDAAFTSASPVVRLVIFQRARQLRRENWKTDPDQSNLTLPVFRALVKADDGSNFEFQGQLGYALKDQPTPDWSGAETALSAAIEGRDACKLKGWLLYELNRADCRIALNRGEDQILPDLRKAAASKPIRKKMHHFHAVVAWLRDQKQMTMDDLAPPAHAT